MSKMRFGIIGCGSIAAGSFAPSLLKSEHAELVAVCRRDHGKAQKFAAQFGGCAAYASAAELTADEQVDAVVVATPTDTHAEFSVLAAQQGKHVLCEKPMARNAAECRQIVEACVEAGVGLAVAYRRRLFPQVLRAQKLIADGAIGRMVCVRTHYSGWMSGGPENWRTHPVIGGAMMEMAVHRLEVLLNFAGQPTEVSALVETVEHDWPVDDTDALLMRFAGGHIGVHSTILTSPPRRDQAIIDGTEGRVIIDPLEFGADHIVLERPDGRQRLDVVALEQPYFDLPMIDDFVQAVCGERQPVCDGITGYTVQATVDAAFQAARSKRAVSVVPY
jgi:1,5-anhydro-D-fructose reductase (1,5-anhydro-D-mannitol-forming)